MLPLEIRRWLVEDEDVEGVHKVLVRHHPDLISSFAEAVSITTAAIAQAGIAGSQGGSSNLQKFRAHHPLTFTGGGDPMVADHRFIQMEKVLEAMEITSDTTKIRLAVFPLESEAQIWWKWARTSRDLRGVLYVSSPLGIRARIGMYVEVVSWRSRGLYSQWT